MTRIYLDYAATAPLRPQARTAMLAVLDGPRNPSSIHAEGRVAHGILDDARATLARILEVHPRELVFTGSGTEADTLAILGVARVCTGRHMIVSAIEHAAVLSAADMLEERGWEITRVGVGSDGVVEPAAVAAALRDDTALVSIMLGNNEIGTLQPIAQIAAIARAAGVLVHTDAVQAAGMLAITPQSLGVDLMTLSAHKVGGPPGVGVLYVRAGTPIAAITPGGGQELGLRGGTENLAGIAGAAAAFAVAAEERAVEAPRLAGLRDRFETRILEGLADVRVTARSASRLPHISHLAIADVATDALLIGLDLEGVALSAGSACAAGSLEPSHVVRALGLPDRWARGVIRCSLGYSTTTAQVDRAADLLVSTVTRMRAFGAPEDAYSHPEETP
jgi:cysteine desulfurase